MILILENMFGVCPLILFRRYSNVLNLYLGYFYLEYNYYYLFFLSTVQKMT